MVSLAALVIPLLALWIWLPVAGLSLRLRVLAVLVTTALGGLPAALLRLLQAGAMDYATIAHLQVPGGWVLATLLFLLLWLLLRDGLWLLLRLAGQRARALRLHALRLHLGMLGLAMAVSSLGVWQALQPPQVREQALYLPTLPPQLDGLRVAVLADIHASPVNDRAYVQTIVERTQAARPDLIVLPGDMVDGDVATTGPELAPLAQLQAPLGVWAAPGNHEYYSGYDAWMAHLRGLGLGILANQSQRIDTRGSALALSGIGDPVYGRTSHNNRDPRVAEGVPPDVAAVAQMARASGAPFHLLLAHQPKFARDNAAQGVDLQLSGHTHGGLILGLDRWLVAPANNGFVRGAYDVDGMRLFVSAGAGLWAGFAVRLGVASSIDLLVLRAGTAP
jgi:predicted MPP superfamily phosphohydrolase